MANRLKAVWGKVGPPKVYLRKQAFSFCPRPIRISSRPRVRGHGSASGSPTPPHPGWGRTWRRWQPLLWSCRRWSGRKPAPPFLWWARRSWTCRQRCDPDSGLTPTTSFFANALRQTRRHTTHTAPLCTSTQRLDEACCENVRGREGEEEEKHHKIRKSTKPIKERRGTWCLFLCCFIWCLDGVFVCKILVIFLYMVSDTTLAHMGDTLPK